MITTKKIIIATGGTGGHMLPAYSLAKYLDQKNIKIKMTSDKRGIKYLKDNHNIEIINITSTTIFKNNLFKSFISFFIIFYSIIKSFFILFFEKPNLVIGMGGYSSFPVCLASKLLRIPLIIYENNLFIGKANKYLLPFVKKILVSNSELEGIPKKYEKKVHQVGNLIREEIMNFNSTLSYNVEKDDLKILILGGSQAAKIFAEKLPSIFKRCVESNIRLKIFQQCLPEQNSILTSLYKNLNIKFEIFNFSNDIISYFSKIDLAITRAGSSMLAELSNANIPFISVPLPSSADNHQLKNAMYYKKNGYSYLIEEKDIDNKMFNLIENISKNSNLLNEIKKKQNTYSDKSVYENINNQILKVINYEKH